MSEPSVIQRGLFGRETRVELGADGIAVRGSARDKFVPFASVRRLRLSRTWMGFARSHVRLTVYGLAQRVSVTLNAEATPSPESAAFEAFVAGCLDRVAAVTPNVVVVLGMSRTEWCLWLGTFALALTGLAGAIATVADDGSLLGSVPPALMLIAGLPVCWRNLRDGWRREVGEGTARAEFTRFGLRFRSDGH